MELPTGRKVFEEVKLKIWVIDMFPQGGSPSWNKPQKWIVMRLCSNPFPISTDCLWNFHYNVTSIYGENIQLKVFDLEIKSSLLGINVSSCTAHTSQYAPENAANSSVFNQ